MEKTYGAIIDPTLREYTQAMRVEAGRFLLLKLHHGVLMAAEGDAELSVVSPHEALHEMLREAGVFPEFSWERPTSEEAWTSKMDLFAAAKPQDPECPVAGENHLEKSVLKVFDRLSAPPLRLAVNIGGFYGGRHGAEPDVPDDPTVELMIHSPGTQVLCWNCEDFSDVTRLQSASQSVVVPEDRDLLAAKMSLPAPFQREVDWLRLDRMPYGQTCLVLRRLLRAGLRPRMVILFLMSQVPPPFRFAPLPPPGPLSADEPGHPAALCSCSLSAAAAELEPHGLRLLRLTGPYALFVREDVWSDPLPLNEMDCYRRATVWGDAKLPHSFVRHWLFAPVEETMVSLWGNISGLYKEIGRPDAVFTLGM